MPADHPPDPTDTPPAAPVSPTGTGDDLGREQRYLDHARAELARMRAKTEALRDNAIGGDKVSSEFLALTLHRRVQSLADDPTSTLFFGRLDPRPRRTRHGALVCRPPSHQRRSR